MPDLLYQGQLITSATYRPLETYTMIAVATAAGAYLLDVFSRPSLMLGVDAVLLVAAAAAALTVFRRPV